MTLSHWLRVALLAVLFETVSGCQPKSEAPPLVPATAPNQPESPPTAEKQMPLRFAVQVGAFEDRAHADALGLRLSNRYQKPVLTTPMVNANRTLYRVRILVGTRAEAEALALAVSRNENLKPWIVPLPLQPTATSEFPTQANS